MTRLILLTGATGYVGGRLLTLLEEQGERVRCMSRRASSLEGRVSEGTEAVSGDVLEPSTLGEALNGVETAYYLIHSLGTGRDFEIEDRQAAQNFAQAARTAGVRRTIYLGGLGDPEQVRVGDALDCWRVEAYQPPHRMRLRAEMRLPGRAWLEFEVVGDEDHCEIRQTAIFDPIGLWGLAYWYAVYPLHQFVFAGMLRNVVREAERMAKDDRGREGLHPPLHAVHDPLEAAPQEKGDS